MSSKQSCIEQYIKLMFLYAQVFANTVFVQLSDIYVIVVHYRYNFNGELIPLVNIPAYISENVITS